MGDDRHRRRRVHAGGAALLAFLRIGHRALGGGFRHRDALQADREPRLVHHGEHAGHAAVFLADQIADGAAAVAIDHDAGRRAVNAELVLEGMRPHVVTRAERAVRVEQEFRHQEQRQPLGARRSTGDAGEHEMDDVVGEVVLAIGDEDLGAGEPVAAVGGALGAGAQRADVGAGMGLGELHRPHPLPGDELFEVGRLELLRSVGGERIGGGDGEHRAEPEGHRRRVPHLGADGADCTRQALAAPFGGAGDPVPPGGGPRAVGLLPARCRRHLAVLERIAVAVAVAIDRRHHLGRDAAGLLDDRFDEIVAEVVEPFGLRLSRSPRRGAG